jgi:hypothetical protein
MSCDSIDLIECDMGLPASRPGCWSSPMLVDPRCTSQTHLRPPPHWIWTIGPRVNGVVLELEVCWRLHIQWKCGVSLNLSCLHERWVFFTVLEHLGQIVNAMIWHWSSTYEVKYGHLRSLDVLRIPLVLDPWEAYGRIENFRWWMSIVWFSNSVIGKERWLTHKVT